MKIGEKYLHHNVPVTVERYDGGLYVWVAYDGTGKRRQLPIATLVLAPDPVINEGSRKKPKAPLKELDPKREKLKAYMKTITNCDEAIQAANQHGVELVVDRTKFGNCKMQLMTRIWSKIVRNEINIEVLK